MIVGIRVPLEVGRVLETQEVPGERHSASDMHITVLYISKSSSVLDVAKSMVAAFGVVSNSRPFQISLQNISSFPRNPDDGLPIICPVVSPELQTIHASLKSEFDRLGVPYRHKYPEFKPHVTLSYVKEPTAEGAIYQGSLTAPISFMVYELELMTYSDSEANVRVSLPFPFSSLEKIAARIAL